MVTDMFGLFLLLGVEDTVPSPLRLFQKSRIQLAQPLLFHREEPRLLSVFFCASVLSIPGSYRCLALTLTNGVIAWGPLSSTSTCPSRRVSRLATRETTKRREKWKSVLWCFSEPELMDQN